MSESKKDKPVDPRTAREKVKILCALCAKEIDQGQSALPIGKATYGFDVLVHTPECFDKSLHTLVELMGDPAIYKTRKDNPELAEVPKEPLVNN